MTEPAAASLARANGNGGQDRQPPRKASPRASTGLADSSKKLPVAYRAVNLIWDGLNLRLRASERVLAVLKCDPAHPSLYRVCALDHVSELLNLTRAKDAAVSFALAALNGEAAVKQQKQRRAPS